MSEIATNPIEHEQSATRVAVVVYALQGFAFLCGVSYIVAIIINYVKMDDVRGTLAESHFQWQIRTFWFSLLWAFIGAVTFLIIIGYFILIANAIWVIYRIVKGWLRLNDGKDMSID